nr:transposase [Phyllobacterium salinisoli]
MRRRVAGFYSAVDSKGGEVATNRMEAQEISVLGLHLLQNCLVYVNTRMLQSVLGDPAWAARMTPEDHRGLTPLRYAHVNPYGRFEIDLDRPL